MRYPCFSFLSHPAARPRGFLLLLVSMLSLRAAPPGGRPEIERLGSYGAVDAYLRNMDDREPGRLKRLEEAGVLSLAPVTIPWGDDLHGGNVHFGWPVAVASADGRNVCVFFQRKPWHYNGADPSRDRDEYTTGAAMVRSTDGGKTWSAHTDMRSFAKGKSRIFPGGMSSVGRLDDGTMLFINDIGVFRSSDNGATWEHFPDAFKTPWPQGVGGNRGPVIFKHPSLGMVVLSHMSRQGDALILPAVLMWASQDGGLTWNAHGLNLTQSVPRRLTEPLGLMLGDRLVVFGRSHDPSNAEAKKGRIYYGQAVFDAALEKNKAAYTNIACSDASRDLARLVGRDKARAFGLWSQDTGEIIYNPVTKRVEAVVTNRAGRGGPRVDDHTRQSLNLWSIDPQALLEGSAEWRFEGTLLERRTLDSPKFFDGMHPGAGVVDLERKEQHLYIYLGFYAGPAGVYKLTRSLDTPRLAAELARARAE
ncbi:hypothetical protein AW736_01290 [Termitidicoccus mucosus]|uniref:Sialidase domain-containing protein n=2 Tax=Termitidicoccus mucosus TaxID=1184151 RepID=A0A178IRD9_9BACT|nr:hypothetical protein AW736_01290 [Opitutaceae bacterium TSB47]